MLIRKVLPEHHLSPDARDVIKLGTGLISTMTALVLGLLIASAKDSYDATSNELIDLSANVVLLDRAFAHYGPETAPIRELLHTVVAGIHDQLWSKNPAPDRDLDPSLYGADAMLDNIEALSPKSDAQRSLQTQALAIATVAGKTRWLIFEQGTKTVATPFLVILICWLVALFLIFGVLAPYNSTLVATLLVCALTVSSAIFLILEMYQPFAGLLRISDASLRSALMHLGGQ
jgi:hypothetical protein